MIKQIKIISNKYNDILNIVMAVSIFFVLNSIVYPDMSFEKVFAVLIILFQVYRFLKNKKWLNF
jgi:hypothetical protein